MVNVGILDRDEKYREGLKASLEVMAGIHILYATDSLTALPRPFLKNNPHLLLLELLGQDSRILENIRETWPEIEIMILGEKDDLGMVRDSLRKGAASYVHKKNAHCFLCNAIDFTYKGGSFVSPEISRGLLRGRFGADQSFDRLSVRELQIAEGLLNGLGYKMIADRYHLSFDSLQVRVKRIYRKLEVNSRGELQALLS